MYNSLFFDRKSADIADGRKSFPSGHTSWAFSGMTFLSLWFASQTGAWCFHLPLPAASLRATRIGRFALTLLPLFWAVFVAITRIQDNVSFLDFRFPSHQTFPSVITKKMLLSAL
jgi:membrane-associated phospholipid phosphatase